MRKLPLVQRLTLALLIPYVALHVIAYFVVPVEFNGFPWDQFISFISGLVLLNILHPWLARRPPHLRGKAIIVGALLSFGPLIASFAMIPLLALWPAVFEPLARLLLTAGASLVTGASLAVGGALFTAGLFLHDADRKKNAGSTTDPTRVDHPTPSP
ncbi:hypothetical protein AAFN86_10195 [Roseomonas sp. CAU 1739]|uniref:hypothetical protein n=1 Tax=Roseomonas sp. CAU 1739 TaxID=3140364 RepID=UPI00325C00C9